MPTFDTPEPIAASIEFASGHALVHAGERDTTVVEVRPTDESSKADVRAAEQTRVDYANGRLSIKAPSRSGGLFGPNWSIDVTVELPADSLLECQVASGTVRGVGRLGDCRLKIASGEIHLDQTGALQVDAASGGISVERAGGAVNVSTASGEVRIASIDGAAVIKSSSGNNWVGDVSGELRVTTAYGDITVDQAHAGVVAKTAAGNVRIGSVERGSVVLETAAGQVDIGIRKGTAAWVDARALTGRVQNALGSSEGPEGSDETAEIRARTSYGDITIGPA